MEGDGGGPRLQWLLGRELGEGCKFTIDHISTPPHKVPAIFARTPGQYEDETNCEKRFLAVKVVKENLEYLAFAIEVFIYTTQHLTTLFVSKADSTGALHLLGLSKDIPSPVRVICTTFLGFLINARFSPDRKLVLSLFARSQAAYLFRGSNENSHKHILDDKRLIKWWCKVIDPLLEAQKGEEVEKEKKLPGSAYLRIPGLEKHEIRTYWPTIGVQQSNNALRWTVGDPFKELARVPELPERCLMPRFPDDPKARFLIELDDTVPEAETNPEPSKGEDGQLLVPQEGAGRWKSVRDLDDFWDMMSYRQETSAGHLVGFIWAVFGPRELKTTDDSAEKEEIHARLPSPAHEPTPDRVTDGSAGQAVLAPEVYQEVVDVLLNGDYTDNESNRQSTLALSKMLLETVPGTTSREVKGRSKTKVAAPMPTSQEITPTMLGSGLVRKKKRPAEVPADDDRIAKKV